MKCKVDSCQKEANRRGPQLCEAHYMRLRRNGDFESRLPKAVLKRPQSGGYILLYAPDHPLVQRHADNRYEYEHRLVFYDVCGAGPFACHWCQKRVTWDDLHIDHLDEVKTNNVRENLVASCAICNQQRGKHRMVEWSKANRATKYTFDGKTKTAKEWADDLGITRVSLKARLANGWPLEKALTEPRGVTGPRRHADNNTSQTLG